MSERKKPMTRVSSEFARFILPAIATMLAAPIRHRWRMRTAAAL